MKRKSRYIVNGTLVIFGIIGTVVGIIAFPSLYTKIFPPDKEEKIFLSPNVKNITIFDRDEEFPFTVSNNYDYPIYELQIEIITDNRSRIIDPLEFTLTPKSIFPKKSGDISFDMNYFIIGGNNSDGYTNLILTIRYMEPHSSLTFIAKPNKIPGEKPYNIYFKNLCYQKEISPSSMSNDMKIGIPFTLCINETIRDIRLKAN